jgi:thiamine pyrophosphate-dependent acetolactate synthase large subunit-like protein
VKSIKSIPFFVEKAVRTALSGRPGPVYLDFPVSLSYNFREIFY